MTDPIADMLTRIRNANAMNHPTVEMPCSKLKLAMLEVMKNEGYIVDYQASEGVKSVITVTLKYIQNGNFKPESVIKGLKCVSKPGLKVYVQADKLPKVLNGLGIAIVSTSKGVMTDREARKLNIGGEVLAYVW